MYKGELDWKPIAILLLLALTWGANMALIKIAAHEVPPIFMAGFRSLVAALCLYIWMKVKGITVFPSRTIALHGIVAGALFGSEFGLVYVGLQHTLSSRMYILVYIAPFFAALGAHYFLKGDRLNRWKIGGLLLAFSGVSVLFSCGFGSFSARFLSGDIMGLGAGLLWAATTVYIKRFLARNVVPLQTLFYQVLFSAPFLLLLSLGLEPLPALPELAITYLSLAFQSIIVAFLSYLVWFELVHRYSVSLLHAFSFFTPVFGVLLSGLLILGEEIGPRLLLALVLVSIGMVCVNRSPRAKHE